MVRDSGCSSSHRHQWAVAPVRQFTHLSSHLMPLQPSPHVFSSFELHVLHAVFHVRRRLSCGWCHLFVNCSSDCTTPVLSPFTRPVCCAQLIPQLVTPSHPSPYPFISYHTWFNHPPPVISPPWHIPSSPPLRLPPHTNALTYSQRRPFPLLVSLSLHRISKRYCLMGSTS